MVSSIQSLRREISEGDCEYAPGIGIELNTSCPNIAYAPPPAYTPVALKPLLQVLADTFYSDQSLTVGLKLPPYTYATQFQDLLDVVASFSRTTASGVRENPFAFLTCTNTLGSSLLFADQSLRGETEGVSSPFTLPTPLGGLAGEVIHSLSLGNVYTFSKLLKESDDEALHSIKVVGVGGVTSPAAADRMRRAGASVVACATLLGREGVRAFELLSQ